MVNAPSINNLMKRFLTYLIPCACIVLLAFTFKSLKNIEFAYPKNKSAAFYLESDKFKKFTKEWRGEDYYYMSEDGVDGFICSVLFYKLNAKEVKSLVEAPRQMVDGPATSPAYPMSYFTSYSKLAKYESNKSQWGDPTKDFMYSQADIKEFNGIQVNQKNMFGYAMFGSDLFVKIHLSKVACTAKDSTVMRKILDGLKIK
jgi:hypothetical protein